MAYDELNDPKDANDLSEPGNPPEEKSVDPKENDIAVDDPANPIQIAGKDELEVKLRAEQLLKEYVDEFSKWESWRRPYENLWNEIYRLYLSVISNFKTPSRSKIFIPVVFQVIEAAVPKLLNVVYPQREFFEVYPEEDSDDQPIADRIKKLMLYQLDRAKFYVKFVDFVKQLLLYGNSFFYVYWKVERRWVYTRTPIRKNVSFLGFSMGSRITGWKETKSYEVVERRPEVEIIDVLDVYPDPTAKTTQEGRAVWHRTWVPIDDIKEMGQGKYKVYANVMDENLVGDDGEGNTVNPEIQAGAMATYPQTRQLRYGARGVTNPTTEEKNMVEVLSRWGRCDLDNDGIKEEALIVIGNRRVMMKAVPNPFHHQNRPIIRVGLFPVPLEFYAMGLIEPVIPLQHELNTVRRQRLDNVNLIINRMWKVNVNADVDLDTLISTPNGVVLTDDMNAVMPLETPDVTQSAYNDAATIQSDIENVTAPRSVQGAPESGRLGRTARGAQLIISQALEKFGTSAKLIEMMGIDELLNMWHQLNMQFIDDDLTLQDPKLYGGLFPPNIRVEDIRANVRFRLPGSSELIDKEAKINQLSAYLGLLKGFLTPATMTLIAQKIWKLMGFDEKELDKVQAMVPPQPAPGAPAPQTVDQNTTAALTSQIQQNGASAPISAPGARPNPTGGR